MIKRLFFFSILVIFTLKGLAQSTNIPLNPDVYHIIDRFDIKGYKALNTNFKSIRRSELLEVLDSLDLKAARFTPVDLRNLEVFMTDNWERIDPEHFRSKKPLFKHFYKNKADFYSVNADGLDLHISPVLYLGAADNKGSEEQVFTNTRGVELRGSISKKVGFYTFLGENQARLPTYVQNYLDTFGVVPHQGFWKKFKETGVDFLTARGHIDFTAADKINFQFGHDRFKVGNGIRSVILSDFSNSYLFLKINTKIWKINYTNLFTQMTADAETVITGGTRANNRFSENFLSLHRLGIDITPNVNIGLFEAVIFGDSTRQGYDFNYLNPIIFYRAVEHQNGSTDNVFLGVDFKANILRHFSLYGQLVFDEFKLDEFTDGSGWWGNKYAAQLGLKYIDAFGIANLDLQFEGNVVRPYMYSHRTLYTNYSHYGQPLAHPLGANFKEFISVVRYQPIQKLNIVAKLISAKQGLDSLGVNWGGDIFKNFGTREKDFGNEIGQGISNQLKNYNFSISYQVKHNLFIDLEHIRRESQNPLNGKSVDSYTAAAIRLNIAKQTYDF